MEEVLACPYCNHRSFMEIVKQNERFFYVNCLNCGAHGPVHATAKEALVHFNVVPTLIRDVTKAVDEMLKGAL